MKVNYFEILLIDVTFYLEQAQKLVFNMLVYSFSNVSYIGPTSLQYIAPDQHQEQRYYSLLSTIREGIIVV